jgi:hypothetical protein
MADLNKFEEMLDRLVNEDKEGAEELFHEIVVEKSREIYESLLEDEDEIEENSTDEEVDESDDEEVDESDDDLEESDDEEVDESDDDEEVSEDFDLDEFEVEADPMADMGGDPADDMAMDMEPPADDMMGGDEGDEDLEDRVVDLEDALDELKAEFEKMMSDEDAEDEGDDEEGEMDMDMDMGGDDEGEEEPEESFAVESDDEEVEEKAKAPKSSAEQMREYVEKVAGGHGAETKGKGEAGANTKSPVAGKNDMGGTASNLVRGDTGDVVEAGKGALKGNGLADTTAKEDSAGNVNVPGGKASKSMKAMPKGHGAEKKGAGESGTNTKSTIGA